jgi:hypothetical protein
VARRKKIKKPLEFSQKVLLAMIIVSIIFTSLSYILAFLDKQTVESLSSTIVSVLWTSDFIALLGYNAQNIVRAWSKNKYTITEEVTVNDRRY